MFTRLRTATRIFISGMRDARTPTMAKVLPLLGILYLFWPLDVLPDFFPLLGQVDDVGVIVLFLWIAWKMIAKPGATERGKRRGVIKR